jgi:type IV fimbrial biogenesis protein FimT
MIQAEHIVRGSLRGFSLVELMVTITISAILLMVAVPAFNDAVLGSKLSSLANDFVASTNLARSEAIKRNAVVTMCASTNGTSCASGDWQQGWVILSGSTVIQSHSSAPTGFYMTDQANAVNTMSFQPTGVGTTQITLTVCRATPTVGSDERVVTVSATGRASVARTTNGVCP